jgi:hypothetical protein
MELTLPERGFDLHMDGKVYVGSRRKKNIDEEER